MQKFDSEKQFGGREQYSVQPMAERLEECELVVDMIIDLLKTPPDNGGTIESNNSYADGTYSYYRTFEYLDTDAGVGGYQWPLVEKTIDIRYFESQGRLSKEQYSVSVATRVHQVNVPTDPIMNIYEITYHGKGHTSVTASVDDVDIISAENIRYNSRPATSYDYGVLFTELGRLSDVLQAQEREDSHLGQ